MQLAIAYEKLHFEEMRKISICCWLAGTLLSSAYAADGAKPPLSTVAVEAPACALLQTHEIESYVGVPATVKESNGTDASAGLCSWAGSTGATVDVMFFPGSSHGVPEGAERAYFDQMIEAQKQKFQPGEFVAVPELADDAWALDLSDNPTQYFAVYLFKGTDNVTIATNGIGLEATVNIARQVAARMQ
jgi:hypothetical protein